LRARKKYTYYVAFKIETENTNSPVWEALNYTVQENIFGFPYGYEADFQGLFNRKSQNGNHTSSLNQWFLSLSRASEPLMDKGDKKPLF